MEEVGKALSTYAREVADIASSPGSTEATYYPAVQRLLTAVLRTRRLPFEVRVNTSQRRTAGGTDLPDLAFYDGAGSLASTRAVAPQDLRYRVHGAAPPATTLVEAARGRKCAPWVRRGEQPADDDVRDTIDGSGAVSADSWRGSD